MVRIEPGPLSAGDDLEVADRVSIPVKAPFFHFPHGGGMGCKALLPAGNTARQEFQDLTGELCPADT